MTALTKADPFKTLLPEFPGLFEGFLSNDLFSHMALGSSIPPVNIRESLKHYDIELAVPGKKKSDFKVEIDDHNLLTISSESEEESEEKKEGKLTRKEFSYSAFSRSFSLPDNADHSSISAAYEDGMLKIFIAKKDGNTSVPHRQITVK